MRGRTGYVLASALLIAGAGLATAVLRQQLGSIAAQLQQVLVPGTHDVRFTETGRHTIFHEQRATVGGRYFASDRQLNGLRLRFQSIPEGRDVVINPPRAHTTYSLADREGTAIAVFEIPQVGIYRLTAWYPDSTEDRTAVLAIGHGIEQTLLIANLSSLAVGLGCGLAACTLGVATFLRRRRANERFKNRSIDQEVHVKATLLCIALGLSVASPAVAQETPPIVRQPLASVDARWENVFCDLTELSRTGASELTVRYRYRNTRKTALPLPHANLVPRTRVLDAASRTLYGVLMDTAGSPISSTMLNGQSARPVPANGTQVHWARLQAPPDTVKSVSVLVEGCQPFDDVTIGDGPRVEPRSAPVAAIASQEGEGEGVIAEITSATRTAGGFVTVTFRYRNTGSKPFAFPHARRVEGAYLLDSVNRKKFEVLRSQQQAPLCSDSLELVGQSGEKLAPGLALALWAKFAAPSESTKTVAITLPFAPPFENVAISGAATGSAGSGTSVAGAVVGLEAALKDLNAKVNDTEIRIDLSADVLFDFDKADIKKEAEPSLQKVATVLSANSSAKVAIEGHTDGKGADAYNQTLSEQRAASVKEWLVANAKVNGANVITKGWGKSKPVARNTKPDGSDDPEGRAKNRRVEIVVRKGA